MDKEIKIIDFIHPLKKRWKLILLVTVATALISGLYSFKTTTLLYQTHTRILLGPQQGNLVSTMAIVIKDPVVLDQVSDRLDQSRSSRALSGQISLSSENDSQFVKITASDADPEMAAQIANIGAEVFIKEIGNILGVYDAKVLSEASPNFAPINAKPRYNMDLGLVAGIVISIGIVLLLDSMDHSIRSEREIREKLHLSVLGTVSKGSKKNFRRVTSVERAVRKDQKKRARGEDGVVDV
ncbi:YveK family protein [Ammoniphilus oxalaticus]|uniref:YveK family protein n=1 Tax=Ammoniphilus oxalaticus TaxID=66863 RepID=UPI001474F4B3|nr:Wzz/FepE/Etk N-terminal domain-containing protein [Ammoniphilus oxalaticus]